MGLDAVAVVVPIGPGERAWRGLLPELAPLPPQAQVILVATAADDLPRPGDAAGAALAAELVTLTAPRGRAVQQNAGARAARRPWLWFLHADSRLAPGTGEAGRGDSTRESQRPSSKGAFQGPASTGTFQRASSTLGVLDALEAAMTRAPDALGYFDLRFAPDGPAAVQANALGAWIRSRLFGLPFGDQGFFLRREVFERLGGFDASQACGEDHAFVWAAHRAGVPVVAAGAPLYSSARKYAEQGWLRTTARHLRLTVAQAWRESRRGAA